MKIVVDTYAWIEIFIGSEKGSKVRDVILNAESVYTPDIVLAEISRKYAREGIAEDVAYRGRQLEVVVLELFLKFSLKLRLFLFFELFLC